MYKYDTGSADTTYSVRIRGRFDLCLARGRQAGEKPHEYLTGHRLAAVDRLGPIGASGSGEPNWKAEEENERHQAAKQSVSFIVVHNANSFHVCVQDMIPRDRGCAARSDTLLRS